MQSIVLPSQQLTSFSKYSLKIAFIIFLKLIQTRTIILVNPLNCYLLSDARRLEKKQHKKKNPVLKKMPNKNHLHFCVFTLILTDCFVFTAWFPLSIHK